MKFLLLLLIPVSVFSQDSSIVKWNARKKGKSPTDISFVITADIKKGYFIHPCEDCSFNDWDDNEPRTDIDFTVDSNWTVKLVFTKNKYKQKTDFIKGKKNENEMVIKGTDTSFKPTTTITYKVDCRVYNKMKLFRGIELVPSEAAITRYKLSLPPLKENASDKDEKKRDKELKDAPKTLAITLPPPDHFLLTINYNINKGKREQTVLSVANTYKTRKEWGWKKKPRRIVNQEPEPSPKTEDK